MKRPRWKKLLLAAAQWVIAFVGLWYVLSNLAWTDRVLVADQRGLPVKTDLAGPIDDNAASYQVVRIIDGQRQLVEVPRTQLIAPADVSAVKLRNPDGTHRDVHVLGLRVTDGPQAAWPLVTIPPRNLWDRFWNNYPADVRATLVMPGQAVGYLHSADYPLIDLGVPRRIGTANPLMLVAALLVFPWVFLIVTYRWWMLMKLVEVYVSLRRAFAINMVGAFFNTFLLGSTGGDVIKAVYAARNSVHRTRAVISVVVDRVIGLYGLIVLGGCAAAVRWIAGTPGEVVTVRCMQVTIGTTLILACTLLGLTIYFFRPVRKTLGIDFILARLPAQKIVQKVTHTLDLFGKHPRHILLALAISLPVHGLVVTSVMLAGMAFGLPLEWWYYWVVVPIVVLVAAIPISPQGAGVMEIFAFLLIRSQNGTMTDALVLTMSIRLIQIIWNLTGAVFVLRGGFSRPRHVDEELEDDLERGKPEDHSEDQPPATADRPATT